jgi:hypothetical protein
MKKYFILLIYTLAFLFCQSLYAVQNPKANPAAIVTSGNMRFTVLTPELIRIEWSALNVFEEEHHLWLSIAICRFLLSLHIMKMVI